MFFKILVEMSRSKATILSQIIRKATHWSVFSLGCLFVILVTSCSTTKYVPQIVEQTKHDTCYIAQVHYDSIYISSNRLIDRGRDTLYIEDKVVEYRYKLLRDTIRIHEVDSIPVIRTVEVTKEVRYVPPWVKGLAWIGGGTILLVVLSIVIKLTIR